MSALLTIREPQEKADARLARGRCARAYFIHAKTANTATRLIQR